MSLIGIIGGSGFYKLLEKKEDEVWPENVYGRTSSAIALGAIAGRKVAFLARHGTKHNVPPHKVPYRANILALKELGVKQIISATAVGSLKPEIKPGEFVVPNQFVNFTQRRGDSFYDGPETTHISSAEPFCFHMRELLVAKSREQGLSVHPNGTAVVVQGPRFSTKAESAFFAHQGWDIINMTMYPEMVLARELELCYANISLVTDYDAGLKADDAHSASGSANDANVKAVSLQEVIKVFEENTEKLKRLILSVIPSLPQERRCECAKALEGARFSA
jgi:5'-methylthioadenosine phosphorylase